ncbi:MAG: GNAT family N-acetyltransferase [Myxococcales bacterium]|nr:GNAT family N-acetyltransferase [Myxococcales bacterium]MDD9965318.1 GNAT family N-acetyltransferase [Myxococcales bacterium]
MTSSNPDARPSFCTVRLTAQPVVKQHAAVMAEVLRDPLTYRFLEEGPPSVSKLERQYEFLAGGKSPDGTEHWLTWILIPKDQTTPIGFVQATVREPDTVHVAYLLAPAAWRKGYGYEAVSGMLEVVFARYDVARAVAEMDTRNVASIGLVEALGFRHAGTNREAAMFEDGVSHEHVYELPQSEWRRRGTTGAS